MRLLPLVPSTPMDRQGYVNPELVALVAEYYAYDASIASSRMVTGLWFSQERELPSTISWEPLGQFLARLTVFENEDGTIAASQEERESIDKFWELYSQELSRVTTLVRLPKGDWKLCGKVLSINIAPSDIPTVYSHSANKVFYSDNRYHI